MDINLILDIVYVIVGFLFVGIPSIIKLASSRKKLKEAKTEIDKSKAINEMKEQMKLFIEAAEIAYKDINNLLKQQGSSAGPAKKESVLIKLQNYATEHNYEYDSAYWSEEIDKCVELTKKVN